MTGILIALMAAVSAQAAPGALCGGYTLDAVMESSIVYDPSSTVQEPVRIRLRADQGSELPDECAQLPVHIRTFDGGAFPLRLQGAGGVLQTRARYSPNVFATGERLELTLEARSRLAAGESVFVDLGDLEGGQYVAPGEYSAQLEIVAGTDISILPARLQVIPALRFVDSTRGGRTDLSLGDPSTAARSASSQFMFLTNTSVHFTLRSDNNGELVHEDGRATGVIPYNAWLNQNPVDLGATETRLSQTFAPGDMVRTGEIRVDVPQTPNLYAGFYRDTITISMTPY